MKKISLTEFVAILKNKRPRVLPENAVSFEVTKKQAIEWFKRTETAGFGVVSVGSYFVWIGDNQPTPSYENFIVGGER